MDTSSKITKSEREGVLHFPLSLFVSPDGLGEAYDIRLGDVACQIILPSLPDDDVNRSGALLPPEPKESRIVETLHKFTWGHISLHDSLTSYVDSALLHFSSNLSPSAEFKNASGSNPLLHSHDFKEIVSFFPEWFETSCEWVEAWTDQILCDTSSTTSSLVHAWKEIEGEVRMCGAGAHISGDIQSAEKGASKLVLKAAFDMASRGSSLPAEHRLLRSARHALRLGETRTSVIHAGTAAEVALAASVKESLWPLNSERATRKIIQQANGVTGLARLRREVNGKEDFSLGRVEDKLAGPRNKAAHEGITPIRETASSALKVAQDVTRKCSPLPTPGLRE